jgi:hypothetical protein
VSLKCCPCVSHNEDCWQERQHIWVYNTQTLSLYIYIIYIIYLISIPHSLTQSITLLLTQSLTLSLATRCTENHIVWIYPYHTWHTPFFLEKVSWVWSHKTTDRGPVDKILWYWKLVQIMWVALCAIRWQVQEFRVWCVSVSVWCVSVSGVVLV